VSRKNEHQQVGQFVVRLDRSIYRSLDKESRLPIPKRYPIVTDYTHTEALPAPLLFDGTLGLAVVEADEER